MMPQSGRMLASRPERECLLRNRRKVAPAGVIVYLSVSDFVRLRKMVAVHTGKIKTYYHFSVFLMFAVWGCS